MKENTGIRVISITRNGETFATDDKYVDPITKLMALLGLEFAAIGAAVAAFAAWIAPFI